jgi:hypothetical protein
MSVEYKEVDKDIFFAAASTISYREDDIKEAKEFGCEDVISCFKKALSPFVRYFIVYEDSRPICAVILRRDGNIVFFISKNVNRKIKLIKVLRRLARKVVRRCGPIITKTASWYTEALRLNKLIGFEPYKLFNGFGLYVLR